MEKQLTPKRMTEDDKSDLSSTVNSTVTYLYGT